MKDTLSKLKQNFVDWYQYEWAKKTAGQKWRAVAVVSICVNVGQFLFL